MQPRNAAIDAAATTERRATLSLLAASAAWGLSFLIIKDAVGDGSAASFLAFRFALAAAALLIIRPGAIFRLSRRQAAHAAALGLLDGTATLLQTIGLQHLSASVSGFITGLYVVLVPILGAAVFGRKIGRNAWFAVGLSVIGLAVLSLHGLTLSTGEMLTLAAAVLYACHVIGLGAWSEPGDAYGMTTLQVGVMAAMSTLAALPGGLTVPHSVHSWWPIVFTGLIEGALALLIQTWAQAHLPPARAAIILTAEPVFAAIFAIAIGGEAITWRLLGGLPVLAAMLLAEFSADPDAGIDPVPDPDGNIKLAKAVI
jgi:drug/metabolite transporter (DMT)-like permease